MADILGAAKSCHKPGMIEYMTEAEAPLSKGFSTEKDAPERRLFARHRAMAPASVLVDGGEAECDVLDISSGGVQIKGDSLPACGERVVLRFGTIGEIAATVAWQQGDRCGLQFHGDEDVINELVMAIAIYG